MQDLSHYTARLDRSSVAPIRKLAAQEGQTFSGMLRVLLREGLEARLKKAARKKNRSQARRST